MDLAVPFVNHHNIRFIDDAAAVVHGYTSIQVHVRWASHLFLAASLGGQLDAFLSPHFKVLKLNGEYLLEKTFCA